MNIPSWRTILLAASASLLLAWCENTRRQTFDILDTPNWPYASTFMEDASRPMPNEWEYEGEVCWATQVSHLPPETQAKIQEEIGYDEMVRECTQPDNPMHDY